MGQGLEIFNAAGGLRFTSADRLLRILAIEYWPTSPIQKGVWTRVVPVGYPGQVWGCMLPLFNMDNDSYDSGQTGQVYVDHLNRPGEIWVGENKEATSALPDFQRMLIYGVF